MTIFDATAFMSIMIVASSLMFGYSASLSRDADATEMAGDIVYAQEMLHSLLRTTVSNASYSINCSEVTLGGQVSIEMLLLVELALVHDGVGPSSFGEAYHLGIVAAASTLAGQYHWALNASYDDVNDQTAFVRLGMAGAGERAAASVSAPMISGMPGRALITLSIWRV